MTRRLELHHPHPVPVDQLRGVLTDPDYLRAKLHVLGGPGAELVSRTETDKRVVVTVRLTVPRIELPPLAQRFVRGDLHLTRIETWHGPTTGGVEVLSNAPGSVKGTILVAPQGTGSLLTLYLAASAKVPFVGGKIEKAMIEKIDDLDDVEHEFTLRWLDQDRPVHPAVPN